MPKSLRLLTETTDSHINEVRWAILATVIAVIGTVFALLSEILFPALTDSPETNIPDQSVTIQFLETQVYTLEQQLQTIPQSTPSGSSAQELARIDQTLEDIVRRIEVVEQAIVDNPSKVLELPMLRRDLDDLKEDKDRDIESIKANVNQAYDVFKWLIVFLGGSIFATNIGKIFGSKSETPSTNDE